MGINFVVAAPRKRQFFDPDALLDNSKSTGFLSGLHPLCVTLLTCRNVAGIVGAGGDWQGAWFGEPVYIVGDGSSQPHLPEIADDFGGRDLWSFVHEEFEDISYILLAGLCASDPERCADLAARAKAGIGTQLVSSGERSPARGVRNRSGRHWTRCGGGVGRGVRS